MDKLLLAALWLLAIALTPQPAQPRVIPLPSSSSETTGPSSTAEVIMDTKLPEEIWTCSHQKRIVLRCESSLYPRTAEHKVWHIGGKKLDKTIAAELDIRFRSRSNLISLPCNESLNGTTITCQVRASKLDNFTLGYGRVLRVYFEDWPTPAPSPSSIILPTTTTEPTVTYTEQCLQPTPTVQLSNTPIEDLSAVSSIAAPPTASLIAILLIVILLLVAITVVLIATIFRLRACGNHRKKRRVVVYVKHSTGNSCSASGDFTGDSSSEEESGREPSLSVVVKGVEEQPQSTRRATRKKADTDSAVAILSRLNTGLGHQSIRATQRLGKYRPPRALLVKLHSKEDVDAVIHRKGSCKHIVPCMSPEDSKKLAVLRKHRQLLIDSGIEQGCIQLRDSFLLLNNELHGYVDSDYVYQPLQ